jgi:F-type H+-transporting ATPase subunit b
MIIKSDLNSPERTDPSVSLETPVSSQDAHSLTTEKDVSYAATTALNNADALAETHSSTEADHGSGGLPQLDTAQWPGQMVWLAIIFGLLYICVSRLFVPRLKKVIDTRQKTLADALSEARTMRDEAEAQAKEAQADLKRAQAEARTLASEAISRTNKLLAEREAKDEAIIMAKLEEAEASIAKARTKAMSHVKSIAKDTTAELIKKLTGKPASEAALNDAYNPLT